MNGLDPLQQDALKELFNMSLGQAVSTLSDMVGEEVRVSVPEIRIVERQGLAEALGRWLNSGVDMVGLPCRLHFPKQGEMEGVALLAAPRASFRQLLDILWNHQHPPDRERERLEQEAMLEVGDLLLYTCVSNLSQFLETEIEGRPAMHVDDAAEVLNSLIPPPPEETANALAELAVRFHLPHRDEVEGMMVFLLELSALPLLRGELNRLLGDLSFISY